MTAAVLASKSYQGTTLAALEVELGEPPVPMLNLALGEASGVMVDAALGNNAQVAGAVTRGLDAIAVGGAGSAAGDGASGTISIPHINRYQEADDFSVVVYVQIDTAPPVSNKYVLCAKAKSGETGRWSLEAYNDAGTVKLRGHIGGTWIGSQQGVVTLALETAYRIVMTYTAGTAALWVDDGAAGATQAIANGGAVNNTADIAILSYNGGLAPLDGICSQFSYWDGALDQTAIEALADATTIAHDTPSPAEFTCLARTTGTLINTHKDLGEILGTAGFRDLATGGNARYDFTGTIRRTDLSGVTWQGKRNLMRLDGNNGGAASFNGACVSGGAFHCANMTTDLNWDSLYQSSNSPVGCIMVRETSMTNMLFEGVRLHGCFDGFQNGSGTRNTCSDVTFRKWVVTMCRDDAIENDNWWPGLVIDDCYIEAFVMFSCRNSGFNGSSRVNTVQNCLYRQLPCRITNVPNRAPPCFKLNSNSVQLDLLNNVFAIQQSTYTGNGDPFQELITHGKIRISEGNVIAWLGSGSYPEPVPSGFTVLTGSTAQDFWADALATWWDAFPGHRFAFDPVAP